MSESWKAPITLMSQIDYKIIINKLSLSFGEGAGG
jgi:hypothetical protein